MDNAALCTAFTPFMVGEPDVGGAHQLILTASHRIVRIDATDDVHAVDVYGVLHKRVLHDAPYLPAVRGVKYRPLETDRPGLDATQPLDLLHAAHHADDAEWLLQRTRARMAPPAAWGVTFADGQHVLRKH